MALKVDGSPVLITGATGFLGSALARVFVAAGYKVRALVRPSSPRELITADVEVVEGDLRDQSSLRKAMSGMEFLIHSAADYRLWAREPSELYDVNVGGTRSILEAARSEGVSRIVYTSSVATLRPGTRDAPSGENAIQSADDVIGVYKRSKTIAETIVQKMADEGLPVVIVNPSTPIGPRDIKPTPTGRMIIEAAGGRMPAFVDTGLNLAHVDDIARGHLLALDQGVIGQRYILGGENVELSKMLAEIARQMGRSPQRLKLPISAVMPLAAIAELNAKFTGKAPFVSFDALRMARHPMYYCDAKARRELGYQTRPWQNAIGDALTWFDRQGMLS